MRHGIVLVAYILASPTSSAAHDVWADGSPVPSWVKTVCCGPSEVHELTPEQVHKTDTGWKIDGYDGDIVPYKNTLPSQDGHYWAFYHNAQKYCSEGSEACYMSSPAIHCFFAPMEF